MCRLRRPEGAVHGGHLKRISYKPHGGERLSTSVSAGKRNRPGRHRGWYWRSPWRPENVWDRPGRADATIWVPIAT